MKPKLPALEDFTVSVSLKVLKESQEEANDVPGSKSLSKLGLPMGRVQAVEEPVGGRPSGHAEVALLRH